MWICSCKTSEHVVLGLESVQARSQGIEPRMHLVPKAPLRAFDRVPDDPLDVRG